MKIAVFVDETGNVLPFSAAGVVDLYSDESGEWLCVNQIPFDLSGASRMNEIRTKIKLLLSEFEDCELLVIDSIKGFAKVVLEEFKVGTWQFKGIFLFHLLDKVREELAKVKKAQVKQNVHPIPVGDEADDCYEINLASILDKDCGLNSRDLLIPFIQKNNFRKLTIDCNHIPKWFESAMVLMKLHYDITETEYGLLRAVVEPIDFETGITERQRIRFSNEGSGGCSSGGCGTC